MKYIPASELKPEDSASMLKFSKVHQQNNILDSLDKSSNYIPDTNSSHVTNESQILELLAVQHSELQLRYRGVAKKCKLSELALQDEKLQRSKEQQNHRMQVTSLQQTILRLEYELKAARDSRDELVNEQRNSLLEEIEHGKSHKNSELSALNNCLDTLENKAPTLSLALVQENADLRQSNVQLRSCIKDLAYMVQLEAKLSSDWVLKLESHFKSKKDIPPELTGLLKGEAAESEKPLPAEDESFLNTFEKILESNRVNKSITPTEIGSMRSRLSQVEERHFELLKEKEALQRRVNALNNEKEVLEQINANSQSRLKGLENARETAESESARLQTELNEAQTNRSSTIAKLKASHDAELTSLKTEINRISAQLESSLLREEAARSSLESQTAKMAQLQESLLSQQTEVDTLKRTLASLEASHKNYKQTSNASQKWLQRNVTYLQQLLEKTCSLKLTGKASAIPADVSSNSAESLGIIELQNELAFYKNRHEGDTGMLRQQLETLQKEKTNFAEQLQAMAEQAEKQSFARLQLAEQRSKIDSLVKQMEKLTVQLGEKRAEFDTLTAERDNLAGAKRNLEDQLRRANDLIKKTRAEQGRKASALATSEEQLNELSAKLSQMDARLKTSQSTLQVKDQLISSLKERLDAFKEIQKDKSDQDQKDKSLRETNTTLKTKLQAKQLLVDRQREQLRELSNHIDSLQEQIDTECSKQEADSRRFARQSKLQLEAQVNARTTYFVGLIEFILNKVLDNSLLTLSNLRIKYSNSQPFEQQASADASDDWKSYAQSVAKRYFDIDYDTLVTVAKPNMAHHLFPKSQNHFSLAKYITKERVSDISPAFSLYLSEQIDNLLEKLPSYAAKLTTDDSSASTLAKQSLQSLVNMLVLTF